MVEENIVLDIKVYYIYIYYYVPLQNENDMSNQTASCDMNLYGILRLNLIFGGEVEFWSSSEVTCNNQCPKKLVNLKRGKPGSLQFALICLKKTTSSVGQLATKQNKSLVFPHGGSFFFLGLFYESRSWTSFILRTHTHRHTRLMIYIQLTFGWSRISHLS